MSNNFQLFAFPPGTFTALIGVMGIKLIYPQLLFYLWLFFDSLASKLSAFKLNN